MPDNATLPDPQEAYNNLFAGVHQRVFFAKLASYGYEPRSNEDARELLELGGKLRVTQQENAIKAASESTSPFTAANRALDTVLEQHGYTAVKQASAENETLAIRRYASELAADPVLYNSVLSLKVAEAEQLAVAG